jgi:hypothetical protein
MSVIFYPSVEQIGLTLSNTPRLCTDYVVLFIFTKAYLRVLRKNVGT